MTSTHVGDRDESALGPRQSDLDPASDGHADPVSPEGRVVRRRGAPTTAIREREPRLFGGSLSDTANVAATIVRIEARRLVHTATRPVRAMRALNRTAADRLLIAPQDIRTADSTVAGDIYAGHLVLGGSFVDAHGQSPFEIEPPTEAWAESLHGFGWLRHLRAANTSLSRANARALVDDWITHSEKSATGIAWRPVVVARRLLSWLSQSPMILAPPDAVFYRRFMKALGRQVTSLQRAVSGGLEGEARLLAAVALAEAGLCGEGLASARRQGSRLLTEELNRQILADGGHLSRNPGVLVDLLLDLLPLRQAYAARSTPVPPALLNAIDRMIPMIRLFRHGDGTLALFNGMGVTEPDVLATVLTYDDVRARPLSNAPHAGYQRVEADRTVLICDTGAPPPRGFSERANAGTLAFELSVGSQRLIVNCGRAASRNRQANIAARTTAAHSTLVLADASSSRFASPAVQRWLGEQIVSGPRTVQVTRTEEAGRVTILSSHDGYASRFGLVHTRRLALDAGGDGLRGEDSLTRATRGPTPSTRAFAVRFHLHPAVRPQIVQGGTAVLLTMPDDERWLFEAEQAVASVEESILFAVAQGARPTSQIVIDANFPETATVRWSLTRLGASRSRLSMP